MLRRRPAARAAGTPPGVFGRLVAVALRFPKLVVAGWLGAAIVLSLAVAPLESVVKHHSTSFLPAGAPSVRGLALMDDTFGSGHTRSAVFVVIVDAAGLSAQDDRAYRAIVRSLRARPDRVTELQDYVTTPKLRTALVSHDHHATYIPVGLASDVGSAAAISDVTWIRALIAAPQLPPTAQVYLTGDPVMLTDLNTTVQQAAAKVTLLSIAFLLTILTLIYRRLVTVLLPLATIGIGLLCTRGVVALLGTHGLAVSTFTPAFIAAIVLGAGTDYSVFLISRFHEEIRAGAPTRTAVLTAGSRIGNVLAASAGTVIVGSASMAFTKLSLLSATGPAIAVSVAITALTSLTLTPVLITWSGQRVAPRQGSGTSAFWRRTGTLVAHRPGRVLAFGVFALIALAALFPTIRLSFDERAAQPATTPGNRGLTALNAHFPPNETLPDYLLVQSPHDLRTPGDLAALNTLSQALAKVPGVQSVRSITQPSGTALSKATLANQISAIAKNLGQAGHGLTGSGPQLQSLGPATRQLASGAQQLGIGTHAAAAGMSRLTTGLDTLATGIGTAASGTGQTENGARALTDGANQLATGLQAAHDNLQQAVSAVGQISTALDHDGLCTLDTVCHRSRDALRTIYLAERDQLLPGLQQAATAARSIATGDENLANAMHRLHAGLLTARDGTRSIAAGQRLFRSKLDQLGDHTTTLAGGIAQLAPGIDTLVAATGKLADGLDHTSSYLSTAGTRAASPDAAGFYLNPAALNSSAFSLAKTLFLSPDGHLARLQVLSTTDPLSSSGQRTNDSVIRAATLSVRNGPLADARLISTGASGFGADLNRYLAQDFRFVAIAVLLAVFLILVITLRALVAPLYLLASVVLSYAAAMGLTVAVWQHLLGHPIDFFLPTITFVLLVAVGADYNILLMSRLREIAETPTRESVATAVSTTGAVITSAGVIFASTFAALITGSLLGLAEIGFAIATGLLLDTFIVRTLVVPACAALLGPNNWWPAHSRATRSNRDL